MEIQEEANNTVFTKIIDTENCIVNSGVTDATTYTSTQHSKDSSAMSGNSLFSHGSSSPPLPTPMDLEGQEEDDKVMNLGSNGKNNGSQTDETSE